MIIYSVTISIEESCLPEWENWMRETHIPHVMQSGCFVSYRFTKLLTEVPEADGVTYNVQYQAKNMEAYDDYSQNFGPALQAETQKRYGGKFVAFRNLLEQID